MSSHSDGIFTLDEIMNEFLAEEDFIIQNLIINELKNINGILKLILEFGDNPLYLRANAATQHSIYHIIFLNQHNEVYIFGGSMEIDNINFALYIMKDEYQT